MRGGMEVDLCDGGYNFVTLTSPSVNERKTQSQGEARQKCSRCDLYFHDALVNNNIEN